MYQYATECDDCKRGTRNYGQARITAVTKGTVHALRERHIVNVYEIKVETLSSRRIETVDGKRSSNLRQLEIDSAPF